ncbi:MAG: hypothetical protein L6Q59_06690 [Ignavibacteriaceae bacterium]|nr:hypothetical protein [Ignavibacteriaceae bacterium]
MFKYFTAALFIMIVFSGVSSAQIKLRSAGAYAAFGSLQGNSSAVTSYGFSANLDAELWFTTEFFFRLSAVYGRDYRILIPEDRTGRNYPYQYAFTLKMMSWIPLTTRLLLEGGFGPAYIFDRTFPGKDEGGAGAALSAALMLDLFDRWSGEKGFSLGPGLEYGLAFTGSTPNYYNFYIGASYTF